jgi:hypothetical protein
VGSASCPRLSCLGGAALRGRRYLANYQDRSTAGALNFRQQRFEADFHFSLVRLRENAESGALYRGEAIALGSFQERFRNVFENFWQIMKRQSD